MSFNLNIEQLENIAQLNNQAAALLESGEFPKGIELLMNALQMVHRCAKEEDETCALKVEGISRYFLPLVAGDLACAAATEMKEQHGFVYTRTIRIVGPMRQPTREGFKSGTDIFGVVVLNLAVANHLKGLSNGAEASRKVQLNNTAKLYKLSQQLINQENIGGEDIILRMVIINNLGQIHSVLGATEEAHRCFTMLMPLLVYWIDNGRQGYCAEDVSLFLDGFFQNTSYTVLKKGEGAPAA
jgi:hypothetical protein